MKNFIPYLFKIDPTRKFVYLVNSMGSIQTLNIYKDNRYFGIGIKKFESCKNKKYY